MRFLPFALLALAVAQPGWGQTITPTPVPGGPTGPALTQEPRQAAPSPAPTPAPRTANPVPAAELLNLFGQLLIDRDDDRRWDDRHNRRFGELPPGLQGQLDWRGALPPGLQRQWNERGRLPPGLRSRSDRRGADRAPDIEDVARIIDQVLRLSR